jgi:3-isopropylmalate dehydrogenase
MNDPTVLTMNDPTVQQRRHIPDTALANRVRIAVLPGDGIGAEVIAGPLDLLRRHIAPEYPVDVTGPWPIGASALAARGTLIPEETLARCEAADAILLGAVGDHPGVTTEPGQAERALLWIRGHFALRVSIHEIWRNGQPNLVVLHSLLGGAHGDASTREESDGRTPARDVITPEPERLTELAALAADLAHNRPDWTVVSVDKANLWATSRLWRRTMIGSSPRTARLSSTCSSTARRTRSPATGSAAP